MKPQYVVSDWDGECKVFASKGDLELWLSQHASQVHQMEIFEVNTILNAKVTVTVVPEVNEKGEGKTTEKCENRKCRANKNGVCTDINFDIICMERWYS